MPESGAMLAQAAPLAASTTRRNASVRLIVLHDDQRSAAQALAAFTEKTSRSTPHYYVAADGAVSQLVDEQRAAYHSGQAIIDGRLRNIDRISIGIVIERTSKIMSTMQATALRRLVLELQQRYNLLADAARVRWVPTPAHQQRGRLQAAALPEIHVRQAVLGVEEQTGRSALLGIETDPATAQRLWSFLQQESARQRGSSFNNTSAFNLYAAQHGLGAMLGPSSPRTAWISSAGQTFNYQHFARDTVYNQGENWAAVQKLSTLLQGQPPAPGSLAALLLQAAYRDGIAGSKPTTGNTDFHLDWSSTQLSIRQGLGPTLSGGYRISVEGVLYTFQVFALDTLYTPLANPETATKWDDVRRLSSTAPGALYEQLWAETYKVCGASYAAASPFQRMAVEAKLGTPLTGAYAANFEGAALNMQVFALDTLYQAGDGPILRMSALPMPGEVTAWQARPATSASAQPAGLAAVTVDLSQADGDRSSSAWPAAPSSMRALVDTTARHRLFGEFSYTATPIAGNAERIQILGSWQQDNIINVHIPQLTARPIRGAPKDGTIQWHRLAAAQLVRLWAAWEQAGLLDRILTWDGSFVPRFIRGSTTTLSNHAFGTAFDINASTNGLGSVPALLGQAGCVRELVTIANRCGFFWGGHFPAPRLDGMHFEVALIQA